MRLATSIRWQRPIRFAQGIRENPKKCSRVSASDLAEARDREAFDRAIDVRITRIRRKIEPDPAHPSVIARCVVQDICSRRTAAR
jgi:hypothetical protein